MILNKQSSHRASNWLMRVVLVVGLSVSLLILILLIQKSWGNAVQLICGFYTIATGFFFIAQLIGFVLSQTAYFEGVEAPKFAMLENEEAEWKF